MQQSSQTRIGVLAMGVLLALSACGGGGGSRSGSDPELDFSGVDAVLDARALQRYAFQISLDGDVVYERRSAGDELRPTFLIASASKALAAAALLTLVRDDGTGLNLDAPVSTYIGNVIDWPQGKAAITTRMLLNHTSGLETENDCLADNMGDFRACVQAIADSRLEAVPGTEFSYGGASYQVAGLVAEVISGMPFDAFFQASIASPVGMSSTQFIGSNPRIAGGAVSTASDYLAFMQMVMDAGLVGDTEIIAPELAMLLRSSQTGQLRQRELPPGAGDTTSFAGYSFGWWTSTREVLIGLSRGPEISDPGVLGTVPWMDFDRRYSAILLTEDGVKTGIEIWDELRPQILVQLVDRPSPPASP
ncbi:MAG: serine hydrolase domain-containing protein [Panacagrimonas sp.]